MGTSDGILLEFFKVMLRPHLLVEYYSPFFNPMLTREQIERLERQLNRALKMIYGFEEHYEDLVKNIGVQYLKER